MKTYEIRSLSAGEAQVKVNELRMEIARERALIASGTRPENPGRIRSMRKTIARILTVHGKMSAPAPVKTEVGKKLPQAKKIKKTEVLKTEKPIKNTAVTKNTAVAKATVHAAVQKSKEKKMGGSNK